MISLPKGGPHTDNLDHGEFSEDKQNTQNTLCYTQSVIIVFPCGFRLTKHPVRGLNLKKIPLCVGGVVVGNRTRNHINTIHRDIILSDQTYGLNCSRRFFFCVAANSTALAVSRGPRLFNSVFIWWKCFPSTRRPLLFEPTYLHDNLRIDLECVVL